MITTKEIEALGFVLNDQWGPTEEWIYDFDSCSLSVQFYDYGKRHTIHMYEQGYSCEIQLKGEVTIERITNLIKALQ